MLPKHEAILLHRWAATWERFAQQAEADARRIADTPISSTRLIMGGSPKAATVAEGRDGLSLKTVGELAQRFGASAATFRGIFAPTATAAAEPPEVPEVDVDKFPAQS